MTILAAVTIFALALVFRWALGHLALHTFRAHPDAHQWMINKLEAAAVRERLRYQLRHGQVPK